jgi:hypothetical protein
MNQISILLTKEQIQIERENSVKRNMLHRKRHIQNKLDYEAQRDEILTLHRDKYIAFRDGKILEHSDLIQDLMIYMDEDVATYVTRVGHESFHPAAGDFLLTAHLDIDDEGKIIK